MKASREETIRFLVLLLFVVAAICAFACTCVNRGGGPLPFVLHFDATETYIPQISSLIPIDDWHSALFMYEGRAISFFFDLFLSNPIESGKWSYAFLYLSAHIVIVSSLVYLIYILSAQRFYYIFISIPLLYSLILLYTTSNGYLDLFFCSTCLLFIVFLIYAKQINIGRLSFWFIIFFICIHLIELRKPSIIPIFFIILTLLLSFHCKYSRHFYRIIIPCNKNSRDEISPDESEANITACRTRPHKRFCFILKSLIRAGITSLALYYVATQVTGWFLPVEHRFPITPMIESDLRISALLRGEGEAIRRELTSAGYSNSEHSFKDSLAAYWAGDWTSGRKINISKVINLYISNWKNHPREAAAAKFIQMVQFVNGGTTPGFIQSSIPKLYPQLKVTPETWKPLVGIPIVRRSLNFGLLCSMPILLLALIPLYKKRIDISSLYMASWIVIIFNLFYIIGYCIVTPTADARYLTPVYLLGMPAIIINAVELFLLLQGKRKSDERMIHPV